MIVLSKDFHFTGDSFQFLEASSTLRSDLHKNCQPPIRCMIFHHLIALNHLVHPKKRNGMDFCKFWSRISESLSSEQYEHVPAAGPAVTRAPTVNRGAEKFLEVGLGGLLLIIHIIFMSLGRVYVQCLGNILFAHSIDF